MSEFWKRLWFGAIFVAVMILGIMWSEVSTLILFSSVVFLGNLEFQNLTGQKKSIASASLHSMVFLILSHGVMFKIPCFTQFFVLFLAIVYPYLERRETKVLAMSLLSLCLISFPFIVLTYFPGSADLRFTLLVFFILIWANDTFAYLVGKKFGRTKLWERLSPKKTWEGFVGGLILTVFFSLFLSPYCSWPRLDGMMIAVIISSTGTAGDLLESSFKRRAGVKDSGSFLPCHGGLLDRFDAVTLSAPVVFVYLWMNGLIDLPSAL